LAETVQNDLSLSRKSLRIPQALYHEGLQDGIRSTTPSAKERAFVTEAGQRLLAVIAPKLNEIDAEFDALSEVRDRPAGTVRMTAVDFAANTYGNAAVHGGIPSSVSNDSPVPSHILWC
jgi:hypothetical protein